MLIVGDGSQTAYRRRSVSWRQVGVNARGRTRYLLRNYRNTKAIVAAAAPFARDLPADDGIGSALCDPADAPRDTSHRPLLIRRATRFDEFRQVVSVVRGLLAGVFAERAIPALEPSDIGVLYRRVDDHLPALASLLATVAPVVWLTPPQRQGAADPRQRILEPGVKLQTIHSAKGLQYKAVILVCADQLDVDPHDAAVLTRMDEERRLLYVALTRPEDYLVVSYTRPASESPRAPELVAKMAASGAFALDDPRR